MWPPPISSISLLCQVLMGGFTEYTMEGFVFSPVQPNCTDKGGADLPPATFIPHHSILPYTNFYTPLLPLSGACLLNILFCPSQSATVSSNILCLRLSAVAVFCTFYSALLFSMLAPLPSIISCLLHILCLHSPLSSIIYTLQPKAFHY